MNFYSKNIISKKVVNRDTIEPGDVIQFNYSGAVDPKPLVFVLAEKDELTGGGKMAKGARFKKGKTFSGINLHYLNSFIVEKLMEETNLVKMSGWNMYKGAFRTYSLKKAKSLKLVEFKTDKELTLEKKIKRLEDEPQEIKQPEPPSQPKPPEQPEKP